MNVIVNSVGHIMPVATKTKVDCEVPGCMQYTYSIYTTCLDHTTLLLKVGVPLKNSTQPQYVYTYTELPETDTMFDFRFSASYASRYHNCHGSANLEEAIPGFDYPPHNESGMKGEGTRLHKIFEDVLRKPETLREAGAFLREIATLWGPHRTAFIKQDERTFLINYFVQHKKAPPIELSTLVAGLYLKSPKINPDKTPVIDKVTGEQEFVETAGTPRRIEHLAASIDYIADLWDTMDPETRVLMVEVKDEAAWLTTKPKTQVDVIMYDKSSFHVIDLKMGDVIVTPINNSQLIYYGVTFGGLDYPKMTLHILQRGAIDSWDCPRAVAVKFQEAVQGSELAILAGDLTLVTGNHCTFCPANPRSRGDKGSKACPAMLTELYGVRDAKQSDANVMDGDDYSDE
jgi:hypothetical protein